eukprot:gene1927-biopygen3065
MLVTCLTLTHGAPLAIAVLAVHLEHTQQIPGSSGSSRGAGGRRAAAAGAPPARPLSPRERLAAARRGAATTPPTRLPVEYEKQLAGLAADRMGNGSRGTAALGV